MRPKYAADQIKNVVTAYFKDKPVKKVYLFGSYARGEADENSDVDLLVELDSSKKIGLKFYGWYQDIENLFERKVDVVDRGALRKDRVITKFAEEQKLLLYVKTD